MTAIFHLEPDGLVNLDQQLVELPNVSLVNGDAGLFLECAEEVAPLVAPLLARAGAVATRADLSPATANLVPALASDLAPFGQGGVIDRVAIRRIGTNEATARLAPARHAAFGRRRPPDGRLRLVLRGEDRLFAWRRVVWARPAVLRARTFRNIHPIVFDLQAVARGEERWARAGAGELTRWARG